MRDSHQVKPDAIIELEMYHVLTLNPSASQNALQCPTHQLVVQSQSLRRVQERAGTDM